jgi:hypothetical protein
MAVQVRFTSLAPSTRVVDIDEADMAALYDIVVDYFVGMLPHLDLNTRSVEYMEDRKAIRDFAQKHGVPYDHPESLTNFFRAALGRTDEQRDSDTRPKLALAELWRRAAN